MTPRDGVYKVINGPVYVSRSLVRNVPRIKEEMSILKN